VADRATFTSESARRIAKVVRRVEAGNRDTSWTPSPPRGGDAVAVGFRVATFTGTWEIGDSKTCTFYQVTATPNTASVRNLLMPVGASNTNTPTICFIAKQAGEWQLINVQHATHAVLTDVSLQPTSLRFSRRTVAQVGVTAATTGISITECDNAAASAEQLNWFFG
jgi:hypothetical protein